MYITLLDIYVVLTKMPNIKLNNLFSSESEIAKAVLRESDR